MCTEYYYCGAERVDDLSYGAIAGEGSGALAQFIIERGIWISVDTNLLISEFDVGQAYADANLGAQPSLTAMPVFEYCRVGPAGPIELIPPFGPTLGWATDAATEYDIPGARANSFFELLLVLNGTPPQMETIPPVGTGYTFVKLPMWLWLVDPLEEVELVAVNETDTVRLATRATFVDATWGLGGAPVTCTLAQMQVFEHGVDSITDTPPHCMFRFDELVDYTMEVTVQYAIEEQLSFRGAAGFAWADTGWVDHPTNPVVPIDNVTEQFTVRELISVNVPEALAGG